MEFTCSRLAVSDEELGCTISLDEKNSDTEGRYLMLQRTYAEDDAEEDGQYLESSDPDKSGFFKNVTITLFPARLSVVCEGELFEIALRISDADHGRLRRALEIVASKAWKFTVQATR